MKKEFGNLRSETVTDIFKTAMAKSRVTRAYISEQTGLSVMTVGKAADAFVDLRVLKQTVSPDAVPGRRSRLLSVCRDRWIGVFDITSSIFTLTICDLALRAVSTFTYRYNHSYFVDENLKFFLDRSEVFINRSADPSLCCGIGVLLPVDDGAPGHPVSGTSGIMNKEQIGKIISPYSFGGNPLIGDIRTFSAYSMERSLPPDRAFLCIFNDLHEITSCFLHKSEDSENIRFCRLGMTPVGGAGTLNDLILSDCSPDTSASLLAKTLFNVVVAVPVDRIIISGNRFIDSAAYASLVSDYLNRLCIQSGIIPPEITSEMYSSSGTNGICAELRKKWFTSYILEE